MLPNLSVPRLSASLNALPARQKELLALSFSYRMLDEAPHACCSRSRFRPKLTLHIIHRVVSGEVLAEGQMTCGATRKEG